jgi:hypothetical protein
LNETNADLKVFLEFWDNLTTAQKSGLRTLMNNRIDTAITALTGYKTEINGF